MASVVSGAEARTTVAGVALVREANASVRAGRFVERLAGLSADAVARRVEVVPPAPRPVATTLVAVVPGWKA